MPTCTSLFLPRPTPSYFNAIRTWPERQLERLWASFRWRYAETPEARTGWFKRLMHTTHHPKARRRLWERRAAEAMRGWLHTENFPLRGLWSWGPFAGAFRDEAGPALLPPLQRIASAATERGNLRIRAIRAIAHLEGEEATASLINLTGEGLPAIREAAAAALQERKTPPARLADQLGRALCASHRDQRCRAARSVTTLQLSTPEILQGLMRMLRESNRAASTAASEALAALGDQAKGAMDALQQVSQDAWATKELRRAAAQAESRIKIATGDELERTLLDEIATAFPFLGLHEEK